MQKRNRWIVLAGLSGGFVVANGCSVAEQIVDTVLLALNIADVWV